MRGRLCVSLLIVALLMPPGWARADTWATPYQNLGNFPLFPTLGANLGVLLGEGFFEGAGRVALAGGAMGIPLAVGMQLLSQSAMGMGMDFGTALGSGIGATLAPLALSALFGGAALPVVPLILASVGGSMLGTWIVQQLRNRKSPAARNPGDDVQLLSVTSAQTGH